MTPPYFHDGSVDSLPKAVRIMAKVQLDTDLARRPTSTRSWHFLGSLTGPSPEGIRACRRCCPPAVSADILASSRSQPH